MRRRWCEDADKLFPWRSLFSGFGLDVGSGDDPLPLNNCTHFDKPDGDANKLSEYFAGHQGLMNGCPFDYIHASQVLEHMDDPITALADWLRLLKPGGHIIVTVPDWIAYEGMIWPSRFNPDHRSTWSTIYKASKAPIHVYIPSLNYTWQFVKLIHYRFVDSNYDYAIGATRDQTLEETEGVECWNEFVLKKNQ